MKKLASLFALLALVLGLGIAACDSGSDDGNTDNTDITEPEGDTTTPEGDATTPEGDATTCTPNCEGKVCGDDGCGGSCGSCSPGVPCVDGQCECEANCEGKECGPDGCGGFCGTGDAATQGCTGDDECDLVNFVCKPPCMPDCNGKECGDDGCGGSCGNCPCDTCDPAAIECGEEGLCVAPDECDCKCIFDCQNTCPAGDQACYTNCVNNASIEGQMAYNNLMTCLDQSGYFECADGDEDCMNAAFDACMDPYYECFHGDLTCAEMGNCLSSCPQGDQECSSNCFSEGSVEALKAWDAMINCLDENGYFDCADGDEDCMNGAFDMCMDEYYACFHGDLDCVDMYVCVQSCPANSDTCVSECFSSGTVEAQNLWQAFLDCLDENGYFDCGEADEECMQAAWDACDVEFTACVHGDLTCGDVFDCFETCAATDQACSISCYAHGTGEAQDLVDAILDCITETCGEQVTPECEDEALGGECADLHQSCLGN